MVKRINRFYCTPSFFLNDSGQFGRFYQYRGGLKIARIALGAGGMTALFLGSGNRDEHTY